MMLTRRLNTYFSILIITIIGALAAVTIMRVADSNTVTYVMIDADTAAALHY
ncbi:MAG: hypothetical protein JWN18_33 [Parcubacteria group bacterium]|nr:hypothetical protein [Parcubacteria group bacterium]